MKKKVLAFAAAAVFTLSVSGCAGGEAAGNGGGSTAGQEESQTVSVMDKDTYLAEIDGLNSAAYEFMQIMTALTEDLDWETAITEIRECKTPFIEFSEIDNPPEGYEEAHAEMAAASKRVGEFLDDYAVFFQDVQDGIIDTDEEYTEKSETLLAEMEASFAELGEKMGEVQEIQ